MGTTYIRDAAATPARASIGAIEPDHVSRHGVSWTAIFAGAAAAASLSLIMVQLGAGMGLGMTSPGEGEGTEAKTIGAAAVSLITVAAAGVGGYLAGRLRRRWVGLQTGEVRFRDTAHGFLVWGWRRWRRLRCWLRLSDRR